MAWTKQQIVDTALEEIGLAAYDGDITTEERAAVLLRLDAMMAHLDGSGIRVGYALPEDAGGSNLSEVLEVQDHAIEALYTNLAIRIAPMFGRQVSMDTKITAKRTLDQLRLKAAIPDPMRLPTTLPLGAGNRTYRYRRNFVQNDRQIRTGQDGTLDVEGITDE